MTILTHLSDLGHQKMVALPVNEYRLLRIYPLSEKRIMKGFMSDWREAVCQYMSERMGRQFQNDLSIFYKRERRPSVNQ